MKILFLDNDPTRHGIFALHSVGHEVHHLYTAAQAIEQLSSQHYDLACLDHDLGGEFFAARPVPEDSSDRTKTLPPDLSESEETGLEVAGPPVREETGLDVAEFMTRLDDPPRVTVVHSFNPVGASRMMAVLARAGLAVTYRRFGRKPYVPELQEPVMRRPMPPNFHTTAWDAVCAMIAGYDSAPALAREAGHLARLAIPELRAD